MLNMKLHAFFVTQPYILPHIQGVKSIINSSKLLSHQPTRLSRLERLLCTCSCTVGIKKVPFSMAIGNGELMYKCFP